MWKEDEVVVVVVGVGIGILDFIRGCHITVTVSLPELELVQVEKINI